VNAFHQPPKAKKEKGLKLRIKVAVQKPKRRKLNFPTVTVPGTPEEQKDTHEVQTQETKKQKGIEDDLNLYTTRFTIATNLRRGNPTRSQLPDLQLSKRNTNTS
jgi:hypothetical protein